jgi:hypothetical protein
VLGKQVLPTGHEHALDASARLLQPGSGLRTGHDNDITRRHADDQLTGDRALQAGPEIAGQEQTRFETIEGQHQGRRLAVELGPRRQDLKVLKCRSPQRLRGHL